MNVIRHTFVGLRCLTETKIQILCDHVDHTRFQIVEMGCQMLPAHIVGPTMFVNLTPALSVRQTHDTKYITKIMSIQKESLSGKTNKRDPPFSVCIRNGFEKVMVLCMTLGCFRIILAFTRSFFISIKVNILPASVDFIAINIFVQCEHNFGYLLLLCHESLETIVFILSSMNL